MPTSNPRRALLRAGAAASLLPWLNACAGVQRLDRHPHYGPLRPVADETTGRPLLQLPDGFRCLSFGWTGDPLADGTPTPPAHDGMAVVAVAGDTVTLVRNHEIGGVAGAFANGCPVYDPLAGGGTTTLRFSAAGGGRWLDARASLAGTSRNCAGGPTPWGSWLTCEESADGPHTGHRRTHGWVFEVPAGGSASASPLTGLGAFVHEAVAVDPATGIVYETEDASPGGFYRFLPKVPGRLAEGGRLQMMKLDAAPNVAVAIDGRERRVFNLGVGHAPGSRWDVRWVDIEDPARQFQRATVQGGVSAQGFVQGASSVRRGEGCWFGDGRVFFASTTGGAARQGQVFVLDPRAQTLTLLYESPGREALSMPDNLALSPRGGLALCEDGDNLPQYLRGLTPAGEVFPLLANHLDLSAAGSGPLRRPSGQLFEGDLRGSELAGVAFHGDWLFFNIQRPGVTFAVTGPWARGAL
jgi:uncharacterized repeat protein (TIGR03803 family)